MRQLPFDHLANFEQFAQQRGFRKDLARGDYEVCRFLQSGLPPVILYRKEKSVLGVYSIRYHREHNEFFNAWRRHAERLGLAWPEYPDAQIVEG